jgi:hypothetical protein
VLANRKRSKENMVYMHNGVTVPNRRNKILPFAAKGIELENIMLFKKATNRKTPIYVFYHMWKLKRKKKGGGVLRAMRRNLTRSLRLSRILTKS